MTDFQRFVPPLDVLDPDRLAALASYDVLDTPADEAFDDVVAIAAAACAAPYAVVSLVAEERQWFKARIGFDADETPIEESVCAHALGETDMLVIPDLTKDPRTSGNAHVVGAPGFRFYGGAVIRNPAGYALGSVCVMDDKPRPEGLTEPQSRVLRALSRQVVALLETRKSLIRSVEGQVVKEKEQRGRDAAAAALREHELKLRLAIDATRMGIFDYFPATGDLVWDARVRELFGLSTTAPVSYEGAFLAGVHPEDREATDAAVKAALDPRGPGLFDAEYRTIAPNGEVRWLAARGQTVVEKGRVVRFVGAARDVTARRAADDRIAATLERYRLVGRVTKDVIWDWDLTNDHVLWNDALTSAYGYPLDSVAPTPGWWFDHVHEDDRDRVRQDSYRAINGDAVEWSHEYRFLRADGSWAEVFDRGSMIRDPEGRPLRMIGAMFDNSLRKAEEERQRLVNRELGHRMKNLLAMVQAIASQTLRSASSAEEAQATLAGRLVALGRAQDILLAGKATGAGMADLVQEAVRPHIDGAGRVQARGPEVEIGSKAALPITLMLHELATNAAKYGALSTGEGRVAISWTTGAGAEGETLRLTWTERGGPPVTPPARKGFGARLIERGLAGQLGATVSLDYPVEGVTCALEAPMARLAEAE